MMSTGSNEDAIRTVFARQGVWCRELGSPLTGLLCELAGRKLDRSTRIGRRILDWPNHAALQSDALPLRLAGGLHALVRRANCQHWRASTRRIRYPMGHRQVAGGGLAVADRDR